MGPIRRCRSASLVRKTIHAPFFARRVPPKGVLATETRGDVGLFEGVPDGVAGAKQRLGRECQTAHHVLHDVKIGQALSNCKKRKYACAGGCNCWWGAPHRAHLHGEVFPQLAAASTVDAPFFAFCSADVMGAGAADV